MKRGMISIGVFLILLFGMTGCKSKGETENTKAEQSKDYVYRMEDIALPESGSMQNINQLLRIGDAIYAYGYDWSGEDVNYKINF